MKKSHCILFFIIILSGFMSEVNAMAKHQSFSFIHQRDTIAPSYKILFDSKNEVIMIQWKGLNESDRSIRLSDRKSKIMQEVVLYTGSTIAYFDTQTLHEGIYYVEVFENEKWIKNKITITK